MAKIGQISKGTVDDLELRQLLQNKILSNVNCHNIGKITAFDKDTQLCTVELLQIKQYNTKSYIPAPITNVPLVILGGGGGNITLPNPVGTICLLIFMDRDMDNFIETGELYAPDTPRMHDFTDCIALSSFKTLVNPISDYDLNAVSLLNTATDNGYTNSSSLKVYSNLIELITSGKVRIANSKQNLAGLMQSFLTACENIVVDTETGLLTASSKQAFTDLKTSFSELLSATGYTDPTEGGGIPSGFESYIQKIDQLESDVAALETTTSQLNYTNISEWLSIDYASGYSIGDSFTAPKNGIVVCWANMSNSSTTIYVNGHAVAYLGDAATGSTWSTATVIVAAGDVVTGLTQNRYFYPAKGQ